MANSTREARKQRSHQAKAIRAARARRKRQTKAAAIVVIVALVFGGSFGAFQLFGTDSSTDVATTDPTTSETVPVSSIPAVPEGASVTGVTPCPPVDGSAVRTSSFEAAPPTCIDPAKAYTATFDTTLGAIKVALDTTATPGTTNNFVVLSRYKYYDGTAIVRTNTGIDIVQGGAPSQSNSDPGPGYTITDEGLPTTYADGDLVMANTGSPNSSGGQYFFGAGANVSQLDSQGSYIKFGKVTEGIDVLHAMLAAHQATDPSNPSEGAPATPIIVNSITISEA